MNGSDVNYMSNKKSYLIIVAGDCIHYCTAVSFSQKGKVALSKDDSLPFFSFILFSFSLIVI